MVFRNKKGYSTIFKVIAGVYSARIAKGVVFDANLYGPEIICLSAVVEKAAEFSGGSNSGLVRHGDFVLTD